MVSVSQTFRADMWQKWKTKTNTNPETLTGAHCSTDVSTRTACHSEFCTWSFLLWPRWDQNSCWMNLKGCSFEEKKIVNKWWHHHIYQVSGRPQIVIGITVKGNHWNIVTTTEIQILVLTLLGAKCWHNWEPSVDIIESLVLTFNEPIGSIVLTLLGANWEWWHYWEPSASKKRSSIKLRVTSRSGWHGSGAVWEVQVAKYFKYPDYVQNVIANTSTTKYY